MEFVEVNPMYCLSRLNMPVRENLVSYTSDFNKLEDNEFTRGSSPVEVVTALKFVRVCQEFSASLHNSRLPADCCCVCVCACV